jgi:hypothetical protein
MLERLKRVLLCLAIISAFLYGTFIAAPVILLWVLVMSPFDLSGAWNTAVKDMGLLDAVDYKDCYRHLKRAWLYGYV